MWEFHGHYICVLTYSMFHTEVQCALKLCKQHSISELHEVELLLFYRVFVANFLLRDEGIILSLNWLPFFAERFAWWQAAERSPQFKFAVIRGPRCIAVNGKCLVAVFKKRHWKVTLPNIFAGTPSKSCRCRLFGISYASAMLFSDCGELKGAPLVWLAMA